MKEIKDLTDVKNFFIQNKTLVLFSSVVLIIFFCWLFLFLFPQLKAIAKTSEEIKILSQRANNKSLKKIDSKILIDKNVDLEKEINFYKNSVLNKEEVTSLLGYLSQSAKKADVRIMGVEPLQGEEKEGDYLPLFIKINLEGKFYQLANFISYLKNCSKFIEIKEFNVVSLNDKKQEGKFVLKSLISPNGVLPSEIFCLSETVSTFSQNPFFLRAERATSILSNIHSLKDIHLQGIAYEQKNSLAIISGCVVQEGEQLGEFRLKQIKEQEILLNKGNESFIIKLQGGKR